MSTEPEFWQPKQAARYLNIHVRTLYEWIGPLHLAGRRKKRAVLTDRPPPPFYKFSHKCVRFPIKEFKEWTMNYFVNGNQKRK